MKTPEKFTQKFAQVQAIRYTGENWRECAEFMGLRAEFDNDAEFDEFGNDGNLYPSMEMRRHFLCLPSQSHKGEDKSVRRGEWIVKDCDGTIFGLTDEEFDKRYE